VAHYPASHDSLGSCASSDVQIGYSTVFFFEYLGPMLIYPLFFLFPSVFYGKYVSATG
jgi:hypothetical protein